MPSHLVVGIDGSDESATALAWAVEDARRRQLDLELVYGLAIPVVSDAYGMVMTRPDIDELCRYSESLLDAARTSAETMDPGVPVRTRLLNGPPAAVLIEASKEAAGLVVGSRGIGAISGRMLGSVSVRVAAKACCPVYVIPTELRPGRGRRATRWWSASTARRTATRRCGWASTRPAAATRRSRVVVAYHVPWLARPVEPALIAEFQSSESAAGPAHRRRGVGARPHRVPTPRSRSTSGLMECHPEEALIQAGKTAHAHRGRLPGPRRPQPGPAGLGQPGGAAGGHPPRRRGPLPPEERR